MKLKLLALAASLAIMLGGCATMPSSVHGSVANTTITDPHHPRWTRHLRTIIQQVNFPDGETHNITVVDQINPRTGKSLPRNRGEHLIYVSNGENMNRTMAKIFVGSIVPAAIVGGSNLGAAEILHGGGLVINNSVSSASTALSLARSRSIVTVKH